MKIKNSTSFASRCLQKVRYSLLVFSSVFSKEFTTEQRQTTLPKETAEQLLNIQLISESFGHIIANNLKMIEIEFDIGQVAKGIQNASAGKEAPMSEIEWMKAITSAQEKYFTEQCEKNMEQAESFLDDHIKTEGAVSLENGKVQYRTIEQGNGKIVNPHFSPLIRYTIKTLDGSIVAVADEEESVCLNETIPGLKAGLVGMKEGEKRILYIHPDLAFGIKECFLPPNALLIFEIEILKADTSETQ